jgi:hypothetical protein
MRKELPCKKVERRIEVYKMSMALNFADVEIAFPRGGGCV